MKDYFETYRTEKKCSLRIREAVISKRLLRRRGFERLFLPRAVEHKTNPRVPNKKLIRDKQNECGTKTNDTELYEDRQSPGLNQAR